MAAYKRLQNLGASKDESRDRLEYVKSQLARGESPLELARFIQEDWKKCNDISRNSMKKMLERYRKDEVSDVAYLQALPEGEKRLVLKRISEKLDVHQELTELVEVQKDRIRLAYEREKSVKVPFTWMSKEILALKELLDSLVNLQFELGLVNRMPRHAQIFQLPDGSTGVTGTMPLNIQPNVSHRLTAIVDLLNRVDEPEVIDVAPEHIN